MKDFIFTLTMEIKLVKSLAVGIKLAKEGKDLPLSLDTYKGMIEGTGHLPCFESVQWSLFQHLSLCLENPSEERRSTVGYKFHKITIKEFWKLTSTSRTLYPKSIFNKYRRKEERIWAFKKVVKDHLNLILVVFLGRYISYTLTFHND